jgi:hypothetical protein
MTEPGHGQQRTAPADSRVAALCAEHGYPGEVADVLDAVLEILTPLTPRSVLLHGSAARGELTWWLEPDGRLRLGSDLEMYVVLDRRVTGQSWRTIQGEVVKLQDSISGGVADLFHIDLGYTTPEGLTSQPRTFRTWDVRATGWTLAGEDLRDALPALDAATIDLRQLNEVPIHRLWEMVFRLPRSMLGGAAPDAEVDDFRLVCSRQALDLTTWLLPHCGLMVPTFARRIEVWKRDFDNVPLNRHFATRSGVFLEECLRGKLQREFSRPAAEIHAEVVDHFRAALRFLLGAPQDAGDHKITAEVLRQGRRHWNGATPRRRAYEAYLLARDGQVRRPVRAVRWWLRQKRPLQVAFLLHLNSALGLLLSDRDARSKLDAADRLLAELWYGYEPREAPAADRFLHARRGYVEYLVESSRWFGPRRDYLYSIID